MMISYHMMRISKCCFIGYSILFMVNRLRSWRGISRVSDLGVGHSIISNGWGEYNIANIIYFLKNKIINYALKIIIFEKIKMIILYFILLFY
jgi:hypothetical protein